MGGVVREGCVGRKLLVRDVAGLAKALWLES